uniref:Uncharacterized protein n=1 Tax=Oryza glumipatula TaxID=40148 RepID=A0A0E0AG64_9ORYZ
MCSGVPELYLLPAEAHAWFRRIVFEVPSLSFYLPPPPNNRHTYPCLSPATTHLSRDSASGILFVCMHGHSWSQWCSQLCSGVATYSISQLLEILYQSRRVADMQP